MENLSDSENNEEGQDQEQLSTSNDSYTHRFSRLSGVDELGSGLHNTLQLEDEISSVDSDLSSGDCDINLNGKSLQKCATFPAPELQSHPCTRSLSLPTIDKLISAMKGSREKNGLPSKKMSVSWDPDVYDPLPTELSYHPKKKVQLEYTKSNKKYDKGKQKGKTMKGGGSGPKDKKHSKSKRSSAKRMDYGFT